MEEKSAVLDTFSQPGTFALSDRKRAITFPLLAGLRRWPLNLQSRARVRTNALEHARTQPTQHPMHRQRVNARRLLQQLNSSAENMIRTQPSVSGISACSRPAIYSRSLVV